MDHAQQLLKAPADVDFLVKTRKSLVADIPTPEKSEHHVETAGLEPGSKTPGEQLRPSDARAAVLAYKADLELSRQAWLAAVKPLFEPGLRILKEESSIARRRGNAELAKRLTAL